MIRTYRLIWQILTKREQKRYLILLGLSLVMSLFEVAGVAVILPFLKIISDPSYIQTNWLFIWFQGVTGIKTDLQVIMATGAIVFLVILVGMAVRAATSYVEIRFGLMRAYSIGSRLLAGYLRQPYVFFLSRNSADVGQNLLSEVDNVIRESVLPGVLLISSTLVTVLIAAFLFAVQPYVAIGATILLVSVYTGVYRSMRGWLARISDARFVSNRDRFHIVNEAMGGIKELKLMGLEDQFLQRFTGPAHAMAQLQTAGLLIGRLPRYALEAVCYGGFILMVLIMVVTDSAAMQNALPTFGLIGMAAMKLFPALQAIYSNLTSMRYSAQSLEKLHHAVTSLVDPEPQDTSLPALQLDHTLELRDLSFSYPGAEAPSLSGLSLTIPARTTIGIVGGTGAGKTTLIDLVLGLLRPDSGEILVDGQVVSDQRIRSWQKSLGYVPQAIFLSDDTVAANIAFGIDKDQIDFAAVERAARIANLHDFVTEELPQTYDTMVGERGVRLSGGQRQRIGIARALYHNPDVLILDEATSALDNLTEKVVMEAVHNLGRAKTIIMIAHRLTTVKNCDIIYLLKRGKVEAHGTYDQLIAENASFRKLAQV
jgi:ATP-binding cassette, subfamily B, bacterial PglK